jgi:molybdopterin-guanine dinucleotide biosynthesis protein A
VTPLGAILTGGRSTRMGRDKADVLVGASSMLARVAAALGTVSTHVVLLGPDRAGWECWPDSVHAEGPLAGIATALQRGTTESVVVVAVDHPFISSETLQRMVGLSSELPVVPVDETGVRQVTCAIYPTSIANAAREEASAGGSIQTLLDRVSFVPITPRQWQGWGEDGRSWFSVDTEEALAIGAAAYPAKESPQRDGRA